MVVMLIYLVVNQSNGKVYVGQCVGTITRRWNDHKRVARNGSKLYLHTAIRKHGVEHFSIHLLSSYATSRSDLDAQEQFYIAKYRASEREYGYNQTPGGQGLGGCRKGIPPWNKGKKYPESELWKFKKSVETRLKMSVALKGRPGTMTGRSHSKETKQRQSVAAKVWRAGRILKRAPMTDETKKRISQALTGRTPSIPKGSKLPAETINKIREAKKVISEETREKLRMTALAREALKRNKLVKTSQN
jgi:group I intron endonuclease